MKKLLLLCLLISSVASPQETQGTARRCCRPGQSAGYATRDATTMSMMGWGIGLAVGIAALCALIPNNEAGSSSH